MVSRRLRKRAMQVDRVRRTLGMRAGSGSDYVARRLIGRGAGYVCQQPGPRRRVVAAERKTSRRTPAITWPQRVPDPQTDWLWAWMARPRGRRRDVPQEYRPPPTTDSAPGYYVTQYYRATAAYDNYRTHWAPSNQQIRTRRSARVTSNIVVLLIRHTTISYVVYKCVWWRRLA